jgi:mono/diheme cytochrome c family protein
VSRRPPSGIRLIDVLAWTGAVLFLAYGLVREAEAADSPATVFAAECGSCHVAYPGNLMKPADWSKVLGRLDRHYGVDASLDPQAVAAVASYLKTTVPASTSRSTSEALPRITTSRWFREEHGEVPSRAWRSPSVKSASNCAACHAGAERGSFDEHSVRVPGEVNRESED